MVSMQRIALGSITHKFKQGLLRAKFRGRWIVTLFPIGRVSAFCFILLFASMMNARGQVSENVFSIADEVDGAETIFWTVQIGVYSGDMPQHIVDSLDRLNFEQFENGNVLYSAGRFDSPRSADQHTLKAQQLGIKDAFTIAYHEGQRISSGRGTELLLETVENWEEKKPETKTSLSLSLEQQAIPLDSHNQIKTPSRNESVQGKESAPVLNVEKPLDTVSNPKGLVANGPLMDPHVLPQSLGERSVDYSLNDSDFVGPPLYLRRIDQLFKRTHSFRKLSGPEALILKGGVGAKSIGFGLRADEVVTRAVLKVRYTHSPSLISAQSHIKVYLNNEFAGLLPIVKNKGGTRLMEEIELDPRAFKGFNELTFRFIGHYTAICEDPMHSSMWVDLSKSSQIELSLKKIQLKNDLSLFPEPFFDPRDFSDLALPVVFPSQPSFSMLQSSGVLSSWFGIQADWRKARFPVYLSSLPDQHSVVFATNEDRPKFLKSYPLVSGPTIEVLSHPYNAALKLLLIHGRNDDDVAMAVKGLVMGRAVMSGHAVSINSFNPIIARKPYDAPRWIRTDRAMKLGELVDDVSKLQVNGYRPLPIKVNLRIPVDLFIWRNQGIPVDLGYSYTRPVVLDESRLTVKINGQFIEAFNLNNEGQKGGPNNKMRIPLIEDWLLNPDSEMLIPAFKLAADNQLEFKFSFARLAEEGCKGEPLYNVNASIDENSILDFTGIPHYAAMPNLSFFASAGFPFTRLADLSETAIILNPKPNKEEIYTFLNLLARMGSSTGYPALNFTLLSHRDIKDAAEKDLLVIGALPNRYLEPQWHENLPLLLDVTTRAIEQPVSAPQGVSPAFGFPEANDTRVSLTVNMDTTGPLGALVGMESPFSEKRSVVVVMASRSDVLADMSERLADQEVIHKIRGSAVVFHEHQLESFMVGKSYYVGSLTPLSLVWYYLSSHPIIMALVAILAVFIMAFTLFQALKLIARKRLSEHSEMLRAPPK